MINDIYSADQFENGGDATCISCGQIMENKRGRKYCWGCWRMQEQKEIF